MYIGILLYYNMLCNIWSLCSYQIFPRFTFTCCQNSRILNTGMHAIRTRRIICSQNWGIKERGRREDYLIQSTNNIHIMILYGLHVTRGRGWGLSICNHSVHRLTSDRFFLAAKLIFWLFIHSTNCSPLKQAYSRT